MSLYSHTQWMVEHQGRSRQSIAVDGSEEPGEEQPLRRVRGAAKAERVVLMGLPPCPCEEPS
jgi:hypothetical protein